MTFFAAEICTHSKGRGDPLILVFERFGAAVPLSVAIIRHCKPSSLVVSQSQAVQRFYTIQAESSPLFNTPRRVTMRATANLCFGGKILLCWVTIQRLFWATKMDMLPVQSSISDWTSSSQPLLTMWSVKLAWELNPKSRVKLTT